MHNEIIAELVEKRPSQGVQALIDKIYLYNPDAANKLIEELNRFIEQLGEYGSYNSLTNKPVLDTTSETSLDAVANEIIRDTIKLHKVSKTGSYSDLISKPVFGDLAFKNAVYDSDIAQDAGITKGKLSSEVQATLDKADASVGAIEAEAKSRQEADEALQKQINSSAGTISTLRTDIDDLGGKVSVIESKIPENASETNQLVAKSDLDSYAKNEALDAKQDKLTAGDNIIISGNVISAIDTSGTSFDAIVVQKLPESGEKGIIYLVPKDGTAPDVYDEYIWVDATSTFELIGTTQVDLTDYLKKTGDTMTGNLELSSSASIYLTGISSTVFASTSRLNLGSPGNVYAYLTGNTSGAFGIYSEATGTPTGVTCYPGQNFFADGTTKTMDLGRSNNVWRTGYINTLSNGSSSITIDNVIAKQDKLVSGTNVKTINNQSILGSGNLTLDGLPSQSGNSGKFLTTDGTTASWATIEEYTATEVETLWNSI